MRRSCEIAGRLYREQQTYFAAHPEDAKQLLKVGRAPRDPKIPPADLPLPPCWGKRY